MNQNIIDYLEENKEKYSKEILMEELRKSGHPEEDISEGTAFVFTKRPPAPLPPGSKNGLGAKFRPIFRQLPLLLLCFIFSYFLSALSQATFSNHYTLSTIASKTEIGSGLFFVLTKGIVYFPIGVIFPLLLLVTAGLAGFSGPEDFAGFSSFVAWLAVFVGFITFYRHRRPSSTYGAYGGVVIIFLFLVGSYGFYNHQINKAVQNCITTTPNCLVELFELQLPRQNPDTPLSWFIDYCKSIPSENKIPRNNEPHLPQNISNNEFCVHMLMSHIDYEKRHLVPGGVPGEWLFWTYRVSLPSIESICDAYDDKSREIGRCKDIYHSYLQNKEGDGALPL